MAYSLRGVRRFAQLIASQVTATKTVDANAGSTRATYSKLAITKSGNFTVNSGGYMTGVRGEVNVAAASTLKDGFLYGSQGKVVCPGAVSQTSALRLCGVQAALDCGASTITAGQLSALWADVAGADPTSDWNDETNTIRATNSTGKPVHSHLFTYGKANYMADLNCDTTGVVAAAGSSSAGTTGGKAADRVIKINLNGTDGYIPIFNANT